MTHSYKSLNQYRIAKTAKLNRRGHNRPINVTLDDPARVVMTDLSDTLAFTIEAKTSIDAASEKMIACGVRLLFVTENDNAIVGIVTAVDILGEKPVQYISENGGNRKPRSRRFVWYRS